MSSNRRTSRLPAAELERRWQATRAVMEVRGIDALIVMSSSNDLGGYQRWLTDTPVTYRRVAILFREEGMTVIEHGPQGMRQTFTSEMPDYPGVTERITVAAFPSVHNNASFEAHEALAALERRGCRVIAFAGRGAMPSGFTDIIAANLTPNMMLCDMTDELDLLRAHKSEIELGLIRQTASIQDHILATMFSGLQPGMTDADVAALGYREGRKAGAEFGIFMVGSAPLGEQAFMQTDERQGRTIEKGDQVTILVEVGGPGGLFAELGRQAVLGRASDDLLEACAQACDLQRYTLSLLKPGAKCSDVFAQYCSRLEEIGQPIEKRLHSHGQGHDLVERPLIRHDEDMLIEENMCLTCHPGFVKPGVFAFICDNYIIGADGPGTSIHATEQKIFEL